VVFYLVFEWCGGGDLGTYLASPAFGVAELSRVALEVLSGVVELHANGIAQ
jgi:serine/threonine protein kinase